MLLIPMSQGVEVPLVQALGAAAGAIMLVVFGVQALRAPRPGPPSNVPAQVPVVVPAPPARPPPPLPTSPQYKRAPIAIHLPQIPPDFPDVWGVNEAVEVVLKTEDKELLDKRQIPGLSLSLGGEPVNPVFNKGTAVIRHTFKARGEKPLIVDMRINGEPQPRRSQRTLKIVEYRTEIAEVFATFKDEAGRTIASLREDATPWEIFDILTGAQPKLPVEALRQIISCYEEAKYSNHPVTRKTYERLIQALLQLERVDL